MRLEHLEDQPLRVLQRPIPSYGSPTAERPFDISAFKLSIRFPIFTKAHLIFLFAESLDSILTVCILQNDAFAPGKPPMKECIQNIQANSANRFLE